MAKIKKIRLNYQRDQGMIITTTSLGQEPKPIDHLLNPELVLKKKQLLEEKNKVKPKDGYWVIIQEWSQCSLKCGGGETVLQRMCVPPKAGGRACIGEAIVKKACNTQPCPVVGKVGVVGHQNTTEVLEPSVKVMQFSTRPQKYTKCIIKESDLLYSVFKGEKENLRTGKKEPILETIPTRVVMNNKTLSVYAGEDYNTIKETFQLSHTTFVPSSTDSYCFILKTTSKKGQFCFFGSERNKENYHQWDYDFNLFKYQCKTTRPVKNLTIDDQELNSKLNDLKQGMLMDREIDLIKRRKQEDIDEKEDEVASSNKLVLKAVQKQVNLEAMVEKEEREREEKQELDLEKEIEKEEEKQKCAMKKIKEKQIENQYNIRAEEMEQENEEMKKKAQEEITITRNKLKNKIKMMKKASERKQAQLKQKLMSLRMKFNNQVKNAYKKGSNEHCSAVTGSKDNYKNYCLVSYPNSPVKYGECVYAENPCIYCCENEFSEIFYSQRQDCIKEICKKKKLIGGRWVWEVDIMDDS